jgi:hypothetical protein
MMVGVHVALRWIENKTCLTQVSRQQELFETRFQTIIQKCPWPDQNNKIGVFETHVWALVLSYNIKGTSSKYFY